MSGGDVANKAVRGIFFDLETTDLLPVGQIFQFSFIAVDKDFQHIEELNGTVKLNRLQIPSIDAILKTGLDVMQHQKNATYESERAAMFDIHGFLSKYNKEASSKKIKLIGYNSNKFDVHYLRTSMIRNGINPYFNNFEYVDALHLVKDYEMDLLIEQLKTKDPGIPTNGDIIVSEPAPILWHHNSRKLEDIVRSYLPTRLTGSFKFHDAREDVLATIEVVKAFIYKNGEFWNYSGSKPKIPAYLQFSGKLDPQIGLETLSNFSSLVGKSKDKLYYFSESHVVDGKLVYLERPMILLDYTATQELYVDFIKFKEAYITNGKKPKIDKSHLKWFNRNTGYYFLGVNNFFHNKYPIDKTLEYFVENAGKLYSSINLSNYFEKKNCDPEAFIYMLGFNGIADLHSAIWKKNMKPFENVRDPKSFQNVPDSEYLKNLKTLYKRYCLANFNPDEKNGELLEKFKNSIAEYYSYRYNGGMKVDKFDSEENSTNEESFHWKLVDVIQKMTPIAVKNDADYALMMSLFSYIQTLPFGHGVSLDAKKLLEKIKVTK